MDDKISFKFIDTSQITALTTFLFKVLAELSMLLIRLSNTCDNKSIFQKLAATVGYPGFHERALTLKWKGGMKSIFGQSFQASIKFKSY